jgi:hypothetical protein
MNCSIASVANVVVKNNVWDGVCHPAKYADQLISRAEIAE